MITPRRRCRTGHRPASLAKFGFEAVKVLSEVGCGGVHSTLVVMSVPVR